MCVVARVMGLRRSWDENSERSRKGLNPTSQRRALFYTFNCLVFKDEVSLRAKHISQSIDRLPARSLSWILLEVLIGPKIPENLFFIDIKSAKASGVLLTSP